MGIAPQDRTTFAPPHAGTPAYVASALAPSAASGPPFGVVPLDTPRDNRTQNQVAPNQTGQNQAAQEQGGSSDRYQNLAVIHGNIHHGIDLHLGCVQSRRLVLWSSPADVPPINEALAPQLCGILSSGNLRIPRGQPCPHLSLPLPLPPAITEGATPLEFDRMLSRPLNLLIIPYQTVPEVIRESVVALSQIRNTVTTVIPPEEIASISALVHLIDGADAVIDLSGSEWYGPVGATAMARGRTVFAPNTKEVRSAWPTMELCPVVHCTPSTVSERVSACLREPRTLRDFGKRCHTFAQLHHRAERVRPLLNQFLATLA